MIADKCLEFHGNQEVVRGVSKDTGVRLVIVEWEMINVQCLTSGLEDGSLGSTDIEYCKPAIRTKIIIFLAKRVANTLDGAGQVPLIEVLEPVGG